VNLAETKAGPISSAKAMAGRSLRHVLRHPVAPVRAVAVAAFFFVVLTGALKVVVNSALELKAASMVFPLAVLLAASGISRAALVAEDVQRGFIDRLLMSSSRRLPVVVGCMLADLVIGAIVTLPLVVLGLAFGVGFRTGIAGVAVIVMIAALWAAVYGGIWYGVAFRTGDPTHERLEYGLVFPLLFLAPSLVPRAEMAGWLRAISAINPLTYLIDAIRTLQADRWDGAVLAKAAVALIVVGLFSFAMAWLEMRARVRTTMGGRKPKEPKGKTPPVDSEADMLRAALEAERQARQRAEQRLAAGGG
jgi:ABC-2 type transport system permease protein